MQPATTLGSSPRDCLTRCRTMTTARPCSKASGTECRDTSALRTRDRSDSSRFFLWSVRTVTRSFVAILSLILIQMGADGVNAQPQEPRMRISPPARHEPAFRIHTLRRDVGDLQFAGDHGHLFVFHTDRVSRYDLAQHFSPPLTLSLPIGHEAAISADGSRVVYATPNLGAPEVNPEIVVTDFASGDVLRTLPYPSLVSTHRSLEGLAFAGYAAKVIQAKGAFEVAFDATLGFDVEKSGIYTMTVESEIDGDPWALFRGAFHDVYDHTGSDGGDLHVFGVLKRVAVLLHGTGLAEPG